MASRKFITQKKTDNAFAYFSQFRYLLNLSKENKGIGIGTDFGGISSGFVGGLSNISKFSRAFSAWPINSKTKEKIAYLNWLTVFRRIL